MWPLPSLTRKWLRHKPVSQKSARNMQLRVLLLYLRAAGRQCGPLSRAGSTDYESQTFPGVHQNFRASRFSMDAFLNINRYSGRYCVMGATRTNSVYLDNSTLWLILLLSWFYKQAKWDAWDDLTEITELIHRIGTCAPHWTCPGPQWCHNACSLKYFSLCVWQFTF